MNLILDKAISCASYIPEPIKRAYNNPPHIAVKVAGYTAAFFLSLYGVVVCHNQGALNDVVFASIVDEILFRGITQSIIRYALKIFNGRDPNPAQQKTQKDIAALATAALYAVANTDGSPLFCFWLLSRTLGYMTESTGSLLPGIAFHGLHNAIHIAAESIGANGLWHPSTILNCIALTLMGKSINPFKAALETYRNIAERPGIGQIVRKSIKWMCLGGTALAAANYASSQYNISPIISSIGIGALAVLRMGYEMRQKRHLKKQQQILAAFREQQLKAPISAQKRKSFAQKRTQNTQTITVQGKPFKSFTKDHELYSSSSIKEPNFKRLKNPVKEEKKIQRQPLLKDVISYIWKDEPKEHVSYSESQRAVQKVMTVLSEAGFVKVRQEGSHAQMQNDATGQTITVPVHDKPICRRAYHQLLDVIAASKAHKPLDFGNLQQILTTISEEFKESVELSNNNSSELADTQTTRAIRAAAAIESALTSLSPDQFGQYLFLKTNVTLAGYQFNSRLNIVQVRKELSLFLACQYLQINPALIFRLEGESNRVPVQTPAKTSLDGVLLTVRNLLLAKLVDSGHIIAQHDSKKLRNAHDKTYITFQKKHLEMCKAKEWFANLESLFA